MSTEIKLPATPEPSLCDVEKATTLGEYRFFTATQMQAYARAAVEADRAQAGGEVSDARDAERYRWLREQPNNTDAPRIDVVYWTVDDESANSGQGLRLDQLDGAIDEALALRKGAA